MTDDIRVGHGYDVHRVAVDRPLLLGGLEVPGGPGLSGHSDADVLLHALVDALLGAAGLGDIGEHFPDTDPRYRGASSAELARQVVGLVAGRGYGVVNADLTVVAERPRLGPVKGRIRRSVAEILGVDPERVNVKAKSGEGLGPVGEGLAMEAHAVVLIARRVE